MQSISKSILISCWKNSKIEALQPNDQNSVRMTLNESTQFENDYREWNEDLHGNFGFYRLKLIII